MKLQLDPEKIKHLKTGDEMLTEAYGPEGSATRMEFEARAREWYCTEVLNGPDYDDDEEEIILK